MSHDSPELERRWFRFSLRSLMLFVVVVAVPLAWKVNRVQHQRAVVAELRKLNILVGYDYHRPSPIVMVSGHWETRIAEPFGPKWINSILGDDFFSEVSDVMTLVENSEVTDDTLNLIATLRSPRSINLMSDHLTDDGLRNLTNLDRLEDLSVVGGSITDVGLSYLGKLTQLDSLTLYLRKTPAGSRQPTDAGIAHLVKLQKLTWLVLGGVEVTDCGLESIAKLRNLTYLELDSSLISDNGIMRLKDMPNLRELQFFGTGVTKDGMEKLRKAIPKCAIGRNPEE